VIRFDPYAFVWGIILLALFFLLKFWKKGFKRPRLYHSEVKSMEPFSSAKTKRAWIPYFLITLSSILLALAFLDPHTFTPKDEKIPNGRQDPTEGRIIFLVLDQSGSMAEPSTSGSQRKIDFLKESMAQFVKGRPGDLIGLEAFARTVDILDPPTLDHEQLLKDLKALNVVQSKDQDGTAIGYAIFKTANLIASLKEQTAMMKEKAPYDVKGAVIILATDGLQDPNPLDKNNPYRSMELVQAADYAKEKGVKVYVVNIEPALAQAKYLPNLRQMERIASSTGGKFYHLQSSSDLSEIMEAIDRIEKTEIREPLDPSKSPSLFTRVSYYPLIASIAAFLLFLGALLELTYFRRDP
jgi:Ca-activated chloride channel family protein